MVLFYEMQLILTYQNMELLVGDKEKFVTNMLLTGERFSIFMCIFDLWKLQFKAIIRYCILNFFIVR